ncbi:DUF3800 domain-containing protein [Actinocorallia sp. B10E7]|uniref:DUF3800 domain-containing protein n=1 Tax=Actinocorallia sp. B10E7 TaxID=3153558 RepID=UPI00325D8CC9
MYFCYLDESGGCEPPDLGIEATPAMVIGGLIIEASHVPALTRDFLALKRRFFPGRFTRSPALDHVLTEIKGSEILQMTRSPSRNKRRQADLFRTGLLDLVEGYGCRLVGRVWVKEVGKSLKPEATYCYAVQDIALHFSQFLLGRNATGVLIADGRSQNLNIPVAHSVFTQKWRTGGDPYPAMLEVPLFAHSDNHVGLQLADLIASTLVFPMAACSYGAPSGSAHGSGRYFAVRTAYGARVRGLQHRYRDETGRWRGGLVVSDPAGKRSGSLLFQP